MSALPKLLIAPNRTIFTTGVSAFFMEIDPGLWITHLKIQTEGLMQRSAIFHAEQ